MGSTERNAVSIFSAAVAVVALVVAGIAVAVSNNSDSTSTTTGGGGNAPIAVNLSEFAITPKELSAKPGNVVLSVTNTGTLEHNLAVTSLDKKTRNLKPGETATLDLGTLAAGSYPIQCDITGHASSGMTGTLVVSESGGSGGTAGGGSVGAGGGTADPNGGGTSSAYSWEDMDKQMADVAAKFLDPASKGPVQGGQLLDPKILPDGTKEFDLTAKVVDWEVEPGKVVKAWTYNGMVPGPEIKVNVGDKVRIRLTNELPESTSLHLHGVRVPNAMDGVDPYTQDPIIPGDSMNYDFTAIEPAVGMYHSHHDAQIQIPNGMAGALLIGDMPIPASLQPVKVTQTVNMVLNDSGTIGLSLNGKSFPATAAYTANVGDSMVVNYYNEGQMWHPMHLHQPSGWVIAKDGVPLPSPFPTDTISVGPGERWTVLYTFKDPGVWAWHCHILNHAETPTGMRYMVTAVIVKDPTKS